MKSPTNQPNDLIYRRLDEIAMSGPQRELAKAQMHAAEATVDAIANVVGEIRASVASVKRGVTVLAHRART